MSARLFGGTTARGGAAAAVADEAVLAALVEVEAALALALADAGVIGADDAATIAAACDPARLDLAAIARAGGEAGNVVVPLVEALTALVPGDAAGHVHRGATSQDILDTALALVARRALHAIEADLAAAVEAARALAVAHGTTLLAGRTLLQQALPVTFALVAAGWLVALDEARQRLAEVRERDLAVQLGGAVGTLASLEGRGRAVRAALAARLGLPEPVLAWHADRARLARCAAALGEAAGAAGKVALDVVLLAQSEVGEVREAGAGRGGSSTMPHKRNPVAAIQARACAARTPGLVATLLAGLPQEHQRAAGAWQAEWETLGDLLRVAGSAVWWIADCLGRLEVDAERMRENLDASGGLLLAEAATTALTPTLGRGAAHHAVEAACRRAVAEGRPLDDVLREALGPDVALPGAADYLGEADALVARALAAHPPTVRSDA